MEPLFLLWRSTPGTGRCECESCPGPGVSVRVELGAAKTLIISHSSTAQVNTGHRPPWRNGDISSQHHTFTKEPLTTSLRNNFQPQAFTQNLTLLQRNLIQTHTFTAKSITDLHRNHLPPYIFTQEPLTASHFYTGTTFNLTLLHRNRNLNLQCHSVRIFQSGGWISGIFRSFSDVLSFFP